MNDEELKEGILELIKTLDKGIRMERNANRFYAAAASNSPTPEGKTIFNWLAEWEAGHAEKLSQKREQLLAHPSMKGVIPPPLDEDYQLSEAGWSVELPPKPSDIDILKMAMINERKAYAFFQRKLTRAAEEGLKTLWDTLAREEEKHIKILGDLRQRLMIDGLWGDIEAIQQDSG
jgi:rubrerythrin